jgi:cell division protein FtsB
VKTTIDRPSRRASDQGRSRLGDLSRPIPVDRRIARHRRSNVALTIAAMAIAGALAAALFVLPVKTLFGQNAEIDGRHDQLTQLQAINADLRREVARLATDDGVREAAREQLGYIEEGEQRQTVVDDLGVPTVLPNGWPYNLVSGVTALRRNPPAAHAAEAP